MFPSSYNWAAVVDVIRSLLGHPIVMYGSMFWLAIEFVPALFGMTRDSIHTDDAGFIHDDDGYIYQSQGTGVFKRGKNGRMYEVGANQYKRVGRDNHKEYDTYHLDNDEEWVY